VSRQHGAQDPFDEFRFVYDRPGVAMPFPIAPVALARGDDEFGIVVPGSAKQVDSAA
jgi:hypothetical protein